jgi:hypothetical protein
LHARLAPDAEKRIFKEISELKKENVREESVWTTGRKRKH